MGTRTRGPNGLAVPQPRGECDELRRPSAREPRACGWKNSLVGRSVGLEDEESRRRQTPSRRAAPSAVDG